MSTPEKCTKIKTIYYAICTTTEVSTSKNPKKKARTRDGLWIQKSIGILKLFQTNI